MELTSRLATRYRPVREPQPSAPVEYQPDPELEAMRRQAADAQEQAQMVLVAITRPPRPA